MSDFTLLAKAFTYPGPGLLEELEAWVVESAKSPAREAVASFVKQIAALSLSEWEELSTRTLDLSPAAAPYIGFQVWGESYQRGEFMAMLNRAMFELDVDPEGELPDHIVPVLRYLNVAERPVPELLEQFEPAVTRMIGILREKDKNNPYLHLFGAALKLVHPLTARNNASEQSMSF